MYLPFALAESIKLFLFVCLFVCFKNFPDSTTVKPMSSNAEGKGLIPGLRAKILHASQPKKKKQKTKKPCETEANTETKSIKIFFKWSASKKSLNFFN